MPIDPTMLVLHDCPEELQVAICEFFPPDEWDHAAQVAYLESRWNAFAKADTTDADHPCGALIRITDGMRITAERSVGYFQVNTCNYPDWEWQRLYNARHNAGTAHMIWAAQGWQAWYFSARQLGLT
jgi:hypothetical protein